LGYTEAELSKLTFKDITHSDHLARDAESIQNLARGEIQSYKTEKRYITKSGAVVSGAVTVTALHDASGKHMRSLVVLEDISQRIRAEAALRGSEQRIRTFLDSTSDMAFMKDENFRHSIANHALCKFFGKTESEIIGKTDFDLMDEQDAAKCRKTDEQTLISNGLVITEEVVGGRYFETMKFPVKLEEGKNGIGAYIRDITERKIAEEAMQRTVKLESLGVLAGGIAHDFNNLLTGIFGYIDLARSSSKDTKTTEYLEATLATMNRAKALTLQLLTFAKGGHPVQRITSLPPLIREAAQFALSGSNISCKFFFDENLNPCNIDKNQIGQVIDNIVINAQQAMPNGGTIEISARNSSLGEKEHPSLSKGEYVKVSIKDNGIGIPKDIMPRIFDPFYTTKTKGHGLGLATCYSIVNRHGGCIDVESEPSNGSMFHVYLPASTKARVAEAPVIVNRKGSGAVLVVDDEEVIRDTVQKMLESLGYAVVCKNDGKEAVDFFKSETPKLKFSAIIFDLTIPGGMGGMEAVKEIRKVNKEIAVFVASGYADNSVMKNPAQYGFTASISKPFTIAELSEMLRAAQGI
jgi:PAS domain S-box-containing protein